METERQLKVFQRRILSHQLWTIIKVHRHLDMEQLIWGILGRTSQPVAISLVDSTQPNKNDQNIELVRNQSETLQKMKGS